MRRLLVLLLLPYLAHASVSNYLHEKEARLKVRIGVSLINTNGEVLFANREKERFPLCSTAKLFVVGAVLAKADKQESLLKKAILVRKQAIDASGYSPISKHYIGKTITVKTLCMAAITESDNFAMNQLLDIAGGINQVNQFMRGLGDKSFRIDRTEPSLNSAKPFDPRDTSTPLALTQSLNQLLFGPALSKSSQTQLKHWLIANKTGDKRIRLGAPVNALVGDKTGTCGHYGATNDIAVIWPDKQKAKLLAIYIHSNQASAPSNDKLTSEVTKHVSKLIQLEDWP